MAGIFLNSEIQAVSAEGLKELQDRAIGKQIRRRISQGSNSSPS